jgi:hypothetical protein
LFPEKSLLPEHEKVRHNKISIFSQCAAFTGKDFALSRKKFSMAISFALSPNYHPTMKLFFVHKIETICEYFMKS